MNNIEMFPTMGLEYLICIGFLVLMCFFAPFIAREGGRKSAAPRPGAGKVVGKISSGEPAREQGRELKKKTG